MFYIVRPEKVPFSQGGFLCFFRQAIHGLRHPAFHGREHSKTEKPSLRKWEYVQGFERFRFIFCKNFSLEVGKQK